MDNIERDEKRTIEYYYNGPKGWIGSQATVFSKEWFQDSYRFLGPYGVKCISEEFHRKYCKFYTDKHWKCIFRLFSPITYSEQFYEDFFDNISIDVLRFLIRDGVLSSEFLSRNSYRIPVEVWSKVYE